MQLIITILVTTTLVGCGTYKDYEMWRRSACDQIADADDRATCLETASRSENEYKQDVENAKGN